MDPRTPVLVGTAQLNDRTGTAEPIEFMARVSEAAFADAGSDSLRQRVESVRVIGGIWPYVDPGHEVAQRLSLPVEGDDRVTTTMTPIGGNEVYDLLASTANDIQNGDLDVAIICSAETLRTRRADRAAGRTSNFVTERDGAAPDHMYGVVGKEMLTETEKAAGVSSAVGFYAMAETALRHERGETPDEHIERISELWAGGSAVASQNPSAWFSDASSAEEIRTVGPRNRMVSSPYRKLMTSNINVDQAAAVILCSAEAADEAGIPRDQWVFPWSGSGAADHWNLTNRWSLSESPAMHLSITKAAELAGVEVADADYLDLYSCFPAAVQVAQRSLGLDPERPFTITGGLTFFGGPLNSYCLHALARSVELLREAEGERVAVLTGNGGFFTKHSAAVVASYPADGPYRSERVQDAVDALPQRANPTSPAAGGAIETYTVTYTHEGEPERAVVSVIDESGSRTFAAVTDPALLEQLLAEDLVGRTVELDHRDDVPVASLAG